MRRIISEVSSEVSSSRAHSSSRYWPLPHDVQVDVGAVPGDCDHQPQCGKVWRWRQRREVIVGPCFTRCCLVFIALNED